jgi:hypothetical protein
MLFTAGKVLMFSLSSQGWFSKRELYSPVICVGESSTFVNTVIYFERSWGWFEWS